MTDKHHYEALKNYLGNIFLCFLTTKETFPNLNWRKIIDTSDEIRKKLYIVLLENLFLICTIFLQFLFNHWEALNRPLFRYSVDDQWLQYRYIQSVPPKWGHIRTTNSIFYFFKPHISKNKTCFENLVKKSFRWHLET